MICVHYLSSKETSNGLFWLRSIGLSHQIDKRLRWIYILDHFDAVTKDGAKEPQEGVDILEDSFVDLEREVEQDSENFVALFDLGVAYERKGMFEEAIVVFERAIKANPNYTSAMEHLAFLLEKLNREKEALPLWEKVLTLKK